MTIDEPGPMPEAPDAVPDLPDDGKVVERLVAPDDPEQADGRIRDPDEGEAPIGFPGEEDEAPDAVRTSGGP